MQDEDDADDGDAKLSMRCTRDDGGCTRAFGINTIQCIQEHMLPAPSVLQSMHQHLSPQKVADTGKRLVTPASF
jgi:hypothetical protein